MSPALLGLISTLVQIVNARLAAGNSAPLTDAEVVTMYTAELRRGQQLIADRLRELGVDPPA